MYTEQVMSNVKHSLIRGCQNGKCSPEQQPKFTLNSELLQGEAEEEKGGKWNKTKVKARERIRDGGYQEKNGILLDIQYLMCPALALLKLGKKSGGINIYNLF